MQQPKTRYARNGDVNIAYQVAGEGPIDLVLAPGYISHVELWWTIPDLTTFVRRLASFSRLILFDKRGTGLSDPVSEPPTLEERMEDLHAVLDAAGSERTALMGISESGPMSILFAATYPDRVSHLILYGTFAASGEDPSKGLALGVSPERIEEGLAWRERAFGTLDDVIANWGEGKSVDLFAPSLAEDFVFRQGFGFYERASASPSMARKLVESFRDIDVTAACAAISVPTLVVHRRDETAVPAWVAEETAKLIPGARYFEVAGIDHIPWIGNMDEILDEVEQFLTGATHAAEPDRVLATVLFTDIVGSTERAAELGDARWRETVEGHDRLVRQHLGAYRGREIKTMGDGFLATFDGPARAIRCGRALCDDVRRLGIEVRAGVHTGECEMTDGDVRGMAVNIGARVASLAAPGEVLVSRAVRDLVIGSGLEFDARGEHELKGVPGSWELLAIHSDQVSEVRLTEPGPDVAPNATVLKRGDRTMLRLSRQAPGMVRTLNRVTSYRARRRATKRQEEFALSAGG